MPKFAVIHGYGMALDAIAVVEHHASAMRVLVLLVIFASGCFEAIVLKSTLACTTWFIGLGALTAWIASSWTTASVIAAAVAFASGLILLTRYYRRRVPPS